MVEITQSDTKDSVGSGIIKNCTRCHFPIANQAVKNHYCKRSNWAGNLQILLIKMTKPTLAFKHKRLTGQAVSQFLLKMVANYSGFCRFWQQFDRLLEKEFTRKNQL
ncbi:hypothetical protein V6W72_04650 [Mannheimia sp. HC-2023]